MILSNMDEDIFYGYYRPNGKVGVRNHVLLLPTVVCCTQIALNISKIMDETIPLYNQLGCGQTDEDFDNTIKTLKGLGKNPNVSSVLIIALGCENIPYEDIAEDIRRTGKRVELIVVQKEGGTIKAIKRGLRVVQELVEEASSNPKAPFKVRDLTVAVECGASDWTSGIASNPAVGYAMDKLIEKGGTVVFSETPEIIGAEHILAGRAEKEEVAKKLLEIVARVKAQLKAMCAEFCLNPSLGNIMGGLTTLEEKSLGAICKCGTKALKGVLKYAEEIPKQNGLFFMDTPGDDVLSITGMVAGGAQLVIFTTGLGSPVGNPIAPVIKVTGNTEMFTRMQDNIDINVGTIIDGVESVEEAGDRIFYEILRVASGKKTKAEILGHREFAMLKQRPSF